MRTIWFRLAVVLSALFVLCAERSAAQSVFASRVEVTRAERAAAGCYDLSFGPWFFGAEWGADPASTMPRRIALDLTPVRFGSRFRFVHAVADSLPISQLSRGASWEAIGADSLGVSWTSSGGTMRLRFAAGGDTLLGRAHAFKAERAAFAEPRASAVAVRVVCDGREQADGEKIGITTLAGDSAIFQRDAALDAERLRRGESLMQMQRLHAAISRFRKNTARLPKDLVELLTMRVERPPAPDRSWLVDAWGRPFVYQPGLDGYSIRSIGQDALQWTNDDIVSRRGPR